MYVVERLRRWAALLAATAAFVAMVPRGARAQEGGEGPVALTVEPVSGALDVRLGDLFADGGLRRAIHQGLPVRVGVRAELWQDRFFDSQRGAAEWRASVVFDPVDRSYHVEVQDGVTETVGALGDASEVLQRRIRLPVRPADEGRYYYLVVVEMETLSLSDLEELQRWLRGDLAPAVSGDEDVEGALARGARRLFVRALGLPARRLRLRTPTFEIERPPGPAESLRPAAARSEGVRIDGV